MGPLHLHVYTGAEIRYELTELGQINVVCGPNSAGKSTILRALDSEQVYVGRRYGDLVDFFNETVMSNESNALRGRGGDGHKAHVQKAREKAKEWLEKRVAENTLCFYDDCDLNTAQLAETWARHNDHLIFGHQEYAQAWRQAIGKAPTRRFIPETRKLDIVRDFAGDERLASPSGENVVLNVYRASASRTKHDEIEKLRRLDEAFQAVTEGTRFDVDLDHAQITLMLAFGGGPLVPAQECGRGFQEVFLILYFAIYDEAQMLIIEEPESHLHPNWQRNLLTVLREMTDKRYVLATHSSTILNSACVDKTFVARYDGTAPRLQDESDRVEALRAVGFAKSDFVTADVLALVEGPHDREAIESFIKTNNLGGKRRIAFHLLGGDSMHFHQLDHLKEAFGSVTAFLDQEVDPGSRHSRREMKKLCDELSIPCKIADRTTMEHYYTADAYKFVFPAQKGIPNRLTMDRTIEEQTGIIPKTQKKRSAALAAATPWSEVRDTDLGAFILELVG